MSEILCDVNYEYRAIERDLLNLARSNSRTLVLPDSTKERCVSAVRRRCNRVFLHPTRFHRRVRIRTREERRLEPHRSRKERMFEILRVETLVDRQGVAPRGWIFKVVEKRLEEKRLVGNTDIYFTGRESCTWRNLGKYEYFILTWLGLHLNAGWYRRLTRPGQQAHRILTNALQRKKKRVSNVLCFSLNIIFRDKKVPSGVKLRWRFTRRKSFERKIFAKILCKKGRLPSKYPFSDVITYSFSKKETLERR